MASVHDQRVRHMVEVYANRDLGALLHNILTQRYKQAGLTPPPLAIDKLGPFILKGSHYIAPKIKTLVDQGIEHAEIDIRLRWDPSVEFVRIIRQTMRWGALLPPHRIDQVTAVLPRTNSEMKRLGCQPLDKSEFAELSKQCLALMRVPVPKGASGAFAEALYYVCTMLLPPPGKGQRATNARRAFRRTVRPLCDELETTYDFATRLSKIQVIGAYFADELTRTPTLPDTRAYLVKKWESAFELFFAGIDLATGELQE